MSGIVRESRCVLLDWGDTLMRDFPEFSGPMAAWHHVEAVPNVREVLVELQFPAGRPYRFRHRI